MWKSWDWICLAEFPIDCVFHWFLVFRTFVGRSRLCLHLKHLLSRYVFNMLLRSLSEDIPELHFLAKLVPPNLIMLFPYHRVHWHSILSRTTKELTVCRVCLEFSGQKTLQQSLHWPWIIILKKLPYKKWNEITYFEVLVHVSNQNLGFWHRWGSDSVSKHQIHWKVFHHVVYAPLKCDGIKTSLTF